MDISTFEEIIVTLVFILPGFLAILLAGKLTYLRKPESVFEHTLWSLTSSIVIFAGFIWVRGIADYESLIAIVFQPDTVLALLLLASLEGIALAILFRFDPLQYLRRIVQVKSKLKFSPTQYVWDGEMARNSPSWIIVYTKTGLEYKGVLVEWTIGETPKELLIANPKLILRDENWHVLDEIEMGDSAIFLEGDIGRIVHL